MRRFVHRNSSSSSMVIVIIKNEHVYAFVCEGMVLCVHNILFASSISNGDCIIVVGVQSFKICLHSSLSSACLFELI